MEPKPRPNQLDKSVDETLSNGNRQKCIPEPQGKKNLEKDKNKTQVKTSKLSKINTGQNLSTFCIFLAQVKKRHLGRDK